jgi:hypothetical protein
MEIEIILIGDYDCVEALPGDSELRLPSMAP